MNKNFIVKSIIISSQGKRYSIMITGTLIDLITEFIALFSIKNISPCFMLLKTWNYNLLYIYEYWNPLWTLSFYNIK